MSLYHGINEIIDHYLNVTSIGSSRPHYAHKTSALRLRECRPNGIDFPGMINEMLNYLTDYWGEAEKQGTAGLSKENWRFEKKLHLSEENTSPEKILEKTIARSMEDDWVNQVPTASGLFDSHSDKQRNIDLVHRVAPRDYDFFELKVNSDTPLKAAMEVLQYGVLYIFAKTQYPADHIERKVLLQANKIHLRVLAPKQYYDDYNLGWMGRSMDAGIKSFLTMKGIPVEMDFLFMMFPKAATGSIDDEIDVRKNLAGIVPVPW
jgi:hypothetical protein